MKKFLIVILLGLMASFTIDAQTYHYSYQYTVSREGSKFKTDYPLGYTVMTFCNDMNFVQMTDSKGVSASSRGYRYSGSANGYYSYDPYDPQGNNEVNRLANIWAAGALNSTYGSHDIGVSFTKDFETMLVHLSNGNNYVFKRKNTSKNYNR